LPCDAQGNFLPEGAYPPPWDEHPDDDFATFKDAAAFELADLLFRRDQMSGTNINDLLQIWASTLSEDQDPPFASKNEMYNTIDNLSLGDAPWKCFSVKYNGEIAEDDTTSWKRKALRSGIEILGLSCITSWGTGSTRMKWTLRRRMYETRTASDGIQISCQGIGRGDKRYDNRQ
jgi:hypothetical protein